MTPIELLQETLRIDSVNPPGNEGPVAEVLAQRLRRGGLETRILRSAGGRPSLVARLEGPTDRPALVLLSHTDVVGVEEDGWTHDPFGGDLDAGAVWGRGALDMKGIAVMHADPRRNRNRPSHRCRFRPRLAPRADAAPAAAPPPNR